MSSNLISALIYIILALVFLYVLRLIMPFFGLPPVIGQVVMILVGVVCLVAILVKVFGVKWP